MEKRQKNGGWGPTYDEKNNSGQLVITRGGFKSSEGLTGWGISDGHKSGNVKKSAEACDCPEVITEKSKRRQKADHENHPRSDDTGKEHLSN